ncbi:MAG: penicillin-binding transpeptidase domain-containing protein [Bacteroidota bacterium]
MTPRHTILTRLYVVLVGLLVLPALVVLQMVRIHLEDGAELRERGERQAQNLIDLPAQRGAILDRRGRALVVNTARYEIAADPTARGFDERAGELYATLGRQTGKGADYYSRRVRDRASRQYVVLVRSLDETSKEELDAADFPGLLIKGSYARRYNYGSLAAHVLGHVNRDLKGLAGLEALFDQNLRGEAGRMAVQMDRRRIQRASVGGTRVEPQNGEDLVLTLDLVRQSILEEELARGVQAAGATWGTAVALDPRTGAILALANVPTYDPNRPGDFTTAARRNHAVVDRLEPGSTFKMVTAIAGVESGRINVTDSLETGAGWKVFHGRTIRDSHAYGTLSFGDAIPKSSNIAMALAAERIGDAEFYNMARLLGFGQPTAIDLPGEVQGSLRRPEAWGSMTLNSMSRGYAVEVTPLQIAVAYAALANGGKVVRPHLVAERRDASTGQTVWTARTDSVRRAFSPRTAEILMPYFEKTVETGGTGPRARVEGLRVAGKTGTARKARNGGYTGAYRASFAGMFPAENPEVVLVIVMDEPRNGSYGGTVAAPVFGAVARRWIGTFPTIAERVSPAGEVPERGAARVPRVRRMPGVIAQNHLRAEGFPVRLAKDAAWAPVDLRDLTPGDTVRLDMPVRLDPVAASDEGEARRMPDLRGRSVRQAVAWLRSMGVEPRVVGTGIVREQSTSPRAALPGTVTLTCRPAGAPDA